MRRFQSVKGKPTLPQERQDAEGPLGRKGSSVLVNEKSERHPSHTEGKRGPLCRQGEKGGEIVEKAFFGFRGGSACWVGMKKTIPSA